MCLTKETQAVSICFPLCKGVFGLFGIVNVYNKISGVREITCLPSLSLYFQKRTQVHPWPGQTESQEDPSYQLVSTCDSLWSGLNASAI